MKHFEITPETTPDTLKARYRELAKTHHPDAGGDTAEFQLLQQEYEQALYELGQNEKFKFLLTDTETFKAILSDTDKMLAKLGFKPLNELLTDKAFQIIENIKLPGALKILEQFKPVAKMQVAEKLSDPGTFATEVEKFVRSTVKSKKQSKP